MSNLIPCSQYESGTNQCKSGFPRIHAVCWGGPSGCPTCGKNDSQPMCMKEELPPHLMQADGHPIFWPKEK